MAEHRPVDHKDSDAEYAAQIREWVAQRAECELLDSIDPTFLIGEWKSSISRSDDGTPDYIFLGDGTYRTPNGFDGPSPNTWTIDGDHFIETYWSPPAPEYEIHDPMQGQECYRCAQLKDGRFAFWNGDSSLLVFLTRIGG
ncbi:hypothetical protein [Thalassoroseus pseudoceratinae]|uniref:hypothetical protein n=1 Tax=Thalassoroseus pseudoceratinae TaxID=2713176 RepID=UPI00142296AD|nr:hypothetical protein [Thalassoroseus pseudoceratinae]